MEKLTNHPWMTLIDDITLNSHWVCPSIRLDQMKDDNEFYYLMSNQMSEDKRNELRE